MKQNVPVAKGQEIELEIQDLAYGGDSITKYKGFTIFIPYGVPGGRILAKITEVKKNFARGEIIKIIKASDIYNKPQCKYFGICGGCDWLNIVYQKQIEYKKKIIANMISHIAGIPNVKIQDMITYCEPFYYRNRVQYKLRYEGQKIRLGFFKARSHEVVAIDKCLIINDKINKIAKIIETYLNQNLKEISLYNEKNKKGYLRYITVKVNSRNEALVTFIVAYQERKKVLDLIADKLAKEINDLKGVVLNINKEEGNIVFGKKEIVLYGQPFIVEDYKNIKFFLNSASFFQINFFIYTKMVEYINTCVTYGTNLLDLYGGVGALTLPLQDKVNQIIVVDNERVNIENLKNTCKNSKLTKVYPIFANAENVVDKIIYEKKIDEIVVDPPRKGLHPKVLFILKNSGIKNIIYISCNPSTFARDIKELKEQYYLEEIVPLDQFAHTYHIELMAKLSIKKGK